MIMGKVKKMPILTYESMEQILQESQKIHPDYNLGTYGEGSTVSCKKIHSFHWFTFNFILSLKLYL